MSTGYIPSREADLDTWLANFKTKIAASPTTYGLTTSDSTAISTAVDNFHTAYVVATSPSTRTHSNIITKNQMKSVALQVVRGYAATIRANSGVTDANKADLGLHIPDGQPTPIPPPATYPVLSITRMSAGVQDLRASDQNTPDRRGKPVGASGLLVYRAVGETPATDPAQATFLAFVSRSDFSSSFATADAGKTATYFGRWTNGKGEVGPWSMGASAPIAA